MIAALATAALGEPLALSEFAPRAVLDRFAPQGPGALVSDGSRYKGHALPLGETAAGLRQP